MTGQLIEFLKDEYAEAGCQPVYIRLFGRSYLIPYPYVRDYEAYGKAFLSDFFDCQLKDFQLYQKYRLAPKYISWQHEQEARRLIVPFTLRHTAMPPAEVAEYVFKHAEKVYFKAVRLASKLAKIYPDRRFQTLISMDQIKKMQKAYYEFQIKNARDETAYLTKKIGLFFSKNPQKVTNTLPKYDIETLKLQARSWGLKKMLAATVSAAVFSACVKFEPQE